MDSNTGKSAHLIDLGAASGITKGSCTGIFEIVGLILPLGLSSD